MHSRHTPQAIKDAIQAVRAAQGVFAEDVQAVVLAALRDQLRRTTQEAAPTWALETDELRLVTVMFIDITGSTTIARQLGNEGWRQLLNEAHARLATVLAAWDGELGQWLGDGMLCFFGARRSRDNDAQRAVSCALAVQEMVRGFSDEVQQRHNLAIRVRVGLATGRAVVGLLGHERAETLVFGETTNLAARLQHEAAPGGVVIDAATYQRVRDDFVLEPLPPVTLRGFDEPVNVYSVLGVRAHPQPYTSVLHLPFVGRNAELGQLREALAHGRGLALIYGEAGVGRSRLLHALLEGDLPRQANVLLVVGQYERREETFGWLRALLTVACGLSDGMTPTQAEQRIATSVVMDWPTAHAEAAAALMGYAAGLGFANHPLAAPLRTGRVGPEAVVQAAVQWLLARAEPNGLLLAVDDLHFVDEASLGLLEHVVRAARTVGVRPDAPWLALVATARPDVQEQPPAWLHSGLVLHVPPLDDSATDQLVAAALAHVEGAPPALHALVRERAAGNPLFVQELLRMLFDNGVFQRADAPDRWRVDTFAFITMAQTLPHGLVGVVQARLDDLPDEARRALQVAAVVGPTFWQGALDAVLGHDSAPHLALLTVRGWVEQRADSRFVDERDYRFRAALYQEVAYTMLPRATRAAVHQQVSAWLAPRAVTQPDLLDMLADHYTNAGEPLRALLTYDAAARVQLDRGLLKEALRAIDAGRAVASSLPRADALPTVSQLWALQARILRLHERFHEASAAAATALRLMDELPKDVMRHERALAACTLGQSFCDLGHYDEAEAALARAWRTLGDSAPPDMVGTVLRALGRLYAWRGALDTSTLYEQQALALARAGDLARLYAAALSALGTIALLRGHLDEAFAAFQEVLARNRIEGSVLYAVMDLRLYARTCLAALAYDQTLVALDEAARLQEQVVYQDPWLDLIRGVCLVRQGHTEAGLALIQAANNRPLLNLHTGFVAQLALLEALYLAGQGEACLAAAEHFVQQVRPHNAVWHGRGLLWLGLAQAACGLPHAPDTLLRAHHTERVYAGYLLWLCEAALACVGPVEDAQRRHQACRQHLSALADRAARHDPAMGAGLRGPVAQQYLSRVVAMLPMDTMVQHTGLLLSDAKAVHTTPIVGS